MASSESDSLEKSQRENERLRAEVERLRKELESERKERAGFERKAADLQKRLEQFEARTISLNGGLAAFPIGRQLVLPRGKCAAPKTSGHIGRAAGHQGSFRLPPTEPSRTVIAELPCCPDCRGRLRKKRVRNTLISDFVRPLVETVRYKTYTAWCDKCRSSVESKVAGQISTATGAAGTTIGPNALSWAALLKCRHGIPFRKVVDILAFWNMPVTAGGLALALQRMAKDLEPFRAAAQVAIRKSKCVFGDETGWKIAGENAWLWAFVNRTVALYKIARFRATEVLTGALGHDYTGMLHSDGWSVYSKIKSAGHQRCLAHLLRTLHRWKEVRDPPRAYIRFHDRLCPLLKDALESKRRAEAERWSQSRRQSEIHRLRQRLTGLCNTRYGGVQATRLRNDLWEHREELFGFIFHREAEGTNNRAERAIRPAVVARKISGGNRTYRGAHAYAVFASLAETCRLRGLDFVETCAGLLRARADGQTHPLVRALRHAA